MSQQSEVKVLYHSDGDYVHKKYYDKLRKENRLLKSQLSEQEKMLNEKWGEMVETDWPLVQANLEIDKLKTILGELDDYTIHTQKCYNNRTSLDECLCGLGDIRKKIKAARGSNDSKT